MRVEPATGAEPLGIDAAVALAREGFPDAALRLVFLPAKPDQPYRVGLVPSGGDRRSPLITVFVDPWSRRVVEVLDPRRFSAGETVLAWQHALHAGQGLGPVWKLLVFLSGFLPLLFAVTGLAMWLLKRRRRQRGGRDPCSRSSVHGAEGRRMRIVSLRCLWVAAMATAVSAAASAQEAVGPPASGIARAVLPRDLSAWSMFWSADSVVKTVMVGLAHRLGRHLDGRSRQGHRAVLLKRRLLPALAALEDRAVVVRSAGGSGRRRAGLRAGPGGVGRGGVGRRLGRKGRRSVRPRAWSGSRRRPGGR